MKNQAIINYLQNEVRAKEKQLPSALTPDEKLLILHDLRELRRHISVIEML